MAKKLSKVKHANLVALVNEAAWDQKCVREQSERSKALLRDYRGRSRHQVIW